MKVLFTTNVPAPYRVDFFNELGKYCDLTVLYERKSASDRDNKWRGLSANNYKEVYLDLKPVGADRSSGNAISKYIGENKTDILIFTNYVSPATMNAIVYCRIHKIPYCVEYDGGFDKKDRFPKNLIKKFLLCGAKAHLTTCEEHIMYLKRLGISQERIFKYPFTSVKNEDISTYDISIIDKTNIRNRLGMTEEKITLSVGQFIPRKGFDVLIRAASLLGVDTGIYIIGGNPSEEFLRLRDEYGARNVHFIEFMKKDKLKEWYLAADVFTLPTREDIWGLVINEAMACGLPVVTTDKCIAGQELVRDKINGYLVSPDDFKALARAINDALKNPCMGHESLKIIKEYCIEKMTEKHIEIFEKLRLIC